MIPDNVFCSMVRSFGQAGDRRQRPARREREASMRPLRRDDAESASGADALQRQEASEEVGGAEGGRRDARRNSRRLSLRRHATG